MKMRSLTRLTILGTLMLGLLSCGKNEADNTGPVSWEMARDAAVTRTNPKTGVTWTISIRTDKGNAADATQKAEDALSASPEIVGMVGLYAYNPPAILKAVEDRNLLDKIKIVGFDEDAATLAAVKSGKIVGTVVQNPYEFGFRSVELLAATIRDQETDVPDNGLRYVPTRVIKEDNVAQFASEIESIKAGNGPVPDYNADQYDTDRQVDIHFVANLFDPFWTLAERGCEKGAAAFNADVSFYIPPTGVVSEQKSYVEQSIIGGAEGLAISARNPAGQTEMINQWAKQIKVICVDSDAPESDRLFYLGTDNVAAGRQAGELLAKELPEGGEVVIFVGELTQANARERAQGVIDALLGQ